MLCFQSGDPAVTHQDAGGVVDQPYFALTVYIGNGKVLYPILRTEHTGRVSDHLRRGGCPFWQRQGGGHSAGESGKHACFDAASEAVCQDQDGAIGLFCGIEGVTAGDLSRLAYLVKVDF